MLPSKSIAVGAVALAGTVAGQYFPPTPEGLKVVHSKHEEGVKISYKEVCPDPHCPFCAQQR